MRAEYYTYLTNGLLTQLTRIVPGNNIEEAHMRNRQMIARWVLEKSKDDKTIEMVEKNGGKYREALELIKLENPFPAVCGHVCPRYCEQGCSRLGLDEAVAVDDIKKFIAEQDLNSECRYVPKKKRDYHDKKIAIIGGGPAGLSCAYYLAIDNYDVTVFEKEKSLGGMLKFGIPSFRLEKNVLDSEIDVLKELGVNFKTGVEVGKDVSLDELRAQGFKAFYLAIGAQKGRLLGIEGEDASGVITAH